MLPKGIASENSHYACVTEGLLRAYQIQGYYERQILKVRDVALVARIAWDTAATGKKSGCVLLKGMTTCASDVAIVLVNRYLSPIYPATRIFEVRGSLNSNQSG